MADEAAQLLVELERLALELHEGVRAAVAAQADAAPEVVQLGEVLHPQLSMVRSRMSRSTVAQVSAPYVCSRASRVRLGGLQ